VLEVDCPTAFEHRYMSGRDKLKLGPVPEWAERWNWRNCKAVIAISEILKEYLIKQGVAVEKITVIPNGADPERFKPGVASVDLRRRYPLSGKVVIGWAGSLVGWSGLENLLRVAKDVLAQRKQAVFLFVGGGKNKEVIEQTFAAADIGTRVFTTGTIDWDDVPPFVDLMDITIAPYPKLDFWYPSSMKIFEYMSAEKAVLASAVGQINDIIQNGENGLLFDPNQSSEFMAKLLLVVDDEKVRRQLAVNARQTVLAKYTWKAHAKTMGDIFTRVLQEKA
jgi:glycosyltransferase involved in cell wall biosynthesis